MSLGNLNVSTINNGAIGRKNLIINGDFQVNQRGVSSGHTASGANEYTLDRWKILTSGQSITWTGTYSKTITAPAGGFTQIIEGLSIRTGTYVISWTGTATCTVDGNSKSSGDTFTLTEGTNCTVTFSSGTVANVQVEQGDAASQFESRSYGEELALCQRYYQKSYNQGTTPGTTTNINGRYETADSNGDIRKTTSLVQTMRTTPTITLYSQTGTSGRITYAGSDYSPELIESGDSRFRIFDNAGSSSNTAIWWHFTADAEL